MSRPKLAGTAQRCLDTAEHRVNIHLAGCIRGGMADTDAWVTADVQLRARSPARSSNTVRFVYVVRGGRLVVARLHTVHTNQRALRWLIVRARDGASRVRFAAPHLRFCRALDPPTRALK